MTRLREADVRPISGGLDAYDARLRKITGVSLRELASRAAGVDEALVLDGLDRITFAAVPVTSGLGVIGGFSDAVAAIVAHLGFDAFVTEHGDAAGTAEARERGADVLMMADDLRFEAVTPGRRPLADISAATAQGFVAGLELMNGGLEGESVLVLGCGPLGVAATEAISVRSATVALCDIDQGRARAAEERFGREALGGIQVEDTPRDALRRYRLIFDATNTGGFIEAAHLTPKTLVAAPGMPCALTPEAMAENRGRVLHDALEIGTATMAMQAAAILAGFAESEKAGEV